MGGIEVVSHLTFADDIDVAFLCRGSRKSFTTLKAILDKFTKFSELEINNSKSHIICLEGLGRNPWFSSSIVTD